MAEGEIVRVEITAETFGGFKTAVEQLGNGAPVRVVVREDNSVYLLPDPGSQCPAIQLEAEEPV